jgi:MFS family permease
MAKKEFIPQFDETKQYKLFSKEILIPFIALSFLAVAPIVQQTGSGVYNNVMMAALGAAKVADLNTVINSVFRAASALVWGGLFDKYNKKTIVIVLTLCQLVAGVLVGLSPNLYVLLFATLIGYCVCGMA